MVGETPTVNELLVFFFLVEVGLVEKGKILYQFGVFLLFCGGRFGREGETSIICVLLRWLYFVPFFSMYDLFISLAVRNPVRFSYDK